MSTTSNISATDNAVRVELFSTTALSTSTSISTSFSYTASDLLLTDILLAGSSSSMSRQTSIVGNNGTATISANAFGTKSLFSPYMTLIFEGQGEGGFSISFSSLSVDGSSQAPLGPLNISYAFETSVEEVALSVNEDSQLSGDFDPFNELLSSPSLSVVTAPAHGTLSFPTPSFFSTENWIYVPNPGYVGSDEFVIRASSGAQHEDLRGTVDVLDVEPREVTGSDSGEICLAQAGDDNINGGGGDDTLSYSSSSSNFKITKSGQAYTIEDMVGGTGTDRLIAFEAIEFSDRIIRIAKEALSQAPKYGADDAFLFDPVFYRLTHLAEGLGEASHDAALEHYRSNGDSPNAWFDADYYASKWNDLAALELDAATLFAHYNLYGVWEGRSASLLMDGFDGSRYLSDNPDVAAYVDANVADFLGSRSNGAIAHYVIYGEAEGRVGVDIVGTAIDTGYSLALE